MTNEKAREVLQDQIDRCGEEYDTEAIEALEVAIKALGSWEKFSDKVWKRAYARGYDDAKTDMLNKIRAEIMDFEEELFHRPNTDYTDYAAVRHCVEIIDKYKAESEDKE